MAFALFKDMRTHISFMNGLEHIGVELETRYEIEEYNEKPIYIDYQLCVKESMFTKNILLLSENMENLKIVASFINNFPPCEKWNLFIEKKRNIVAKGYFILKEITKFINTENKEDKIENIIHSIGGAEEEIDFVINQSNKKTLGYFPINDKRKALGYALLVDIGSTFPAKQEELEVLLTSMKKYLKTKNNKTV